MAARSRDARLERAAAARAAHAEMAFHERLIAFAGGDA
jgi:hypothetical protein